MMDPNETLRLIREALDRGDIDTAVQLAVSLGRWVDSGGFEPADPAWRDVMIEVTVRMTFKGEPWS